MPLGSWLKKGIRLYKTILLKAVSKDIRIVHVVWDFRPWDIMTKVRYFLMFQIYNLRTLEVEHDLESCQKP